MTGASIAEAIPVAISPILTRLYSPEDFGILSVFVAFLTLMGYVVNARYDAAIMLPKSDKEAINLFALGMSINFIISLCLLIIIFLFSNEIAIILGNEKIKFWLYFLPISIFLAGVFNIANYFNNRKKEYCNIKNAYLFKSITLSSIQVLMGILKSGASGLISGLIISQIFANGRLVKTVIRDRTNISLISKNEIIKVAKKFKKFPKILIWGGVSSISSTHITNLLISSLFSLSTLGFYALAQRLLALPSALISDQIGKAFFQTYSESSNETKSGYDIFIKTFKNLIYIGVPIYLLIYIFIENIFAIVFGEEWRIAGSYAKIMAPVFFFAFILDPVSLINQVNQKGSIEIFWQFGLLILNITILTVGNFYSLTFESILIILSLLISAYYLLYFYLIKKANFAQNS